MIRHEIAEMIREYWEEIPELADIKVVASERQLEEILDLTAVLRMVSIGRSPDLPLSHRNVKMNVVLISGMDSADHAADELEERLEHVLNWLDDFFRHEDAEFVTYGEGRYAYLIPITVLAANTAPEIKETI